MMCFSVRSHFNKPVSFPQMPLCREMPVLCVQQKLALSSRNSLPSCQVSFYTLLIMLSYDIKQYMYKYQPVILKQFPVCFAVIMQLDFQMISLQHYNKQTECCERALQIQYKEGLLHCSTSRVLSECRIHLPKSCSSHKMKSLGSVC